MNSSSVSTLAGSVSLSFNFPSLPYTFNFGLVRGKTNQYEGDPAGTCVARAVHKFLGLKNFI
jgi:hypothetical protein